MNATECSMLANGFHANVPAEVYHSLPGASSTRLNRLRETCPATVRFEMDNPREQTAEMSLGSAAHDCILLPRRFDEHYAKCPKIDKRTKEGKAAWAQIQAEQAGKILLAEDDFERCVRMYEAVEDHPMASKLLWGSEGDYELSGLWQSDCTCRMRADRLTTINGMPVIIDLKTTVCASHDSFIRSVIRYGYFRQAAFYLHGAESLDRRAERFVVVAVEKEPPFNVAVWSIPPELAEHGWKQIQPLMRLWGECEASGAWPGYAGDIMQLSAPAWLFREEF